MSNKDTPILLFAMWIVYETLSSATGWRVGTPGAPGWQRINRAGLFVEVLDRISPMNQVWAQVDPLAHSLGH